MPFEEYLLKSSLQGQTAFCLRTHVHNGVVQFFIHPLGEDGLTLDFRVKGNITIPILNAQNPDSPAVKSEEQV